jgi:hypothetical protein
MKIEIIPLEFLKKKKTEGQVKNVLLADSEGCGTRRHA